MSDMNQPRFDGLPLFSLSRIGEARYDEMEDCVVAAENDLKARMLAQSEGGCEKRLMPKVWLTSSLSTCEMIADCSIYHVATMICSDVREG